MGRCGFSSDSRRWSLSLEVRRADPDLRALRPRACGRRRLPSRRFRPRRRLASSRHRDRAPLARPFRPARSARVVPLRSSPPGAGRCGRVDRGAHGTTGWLRRAGGRFLADRGVQIDPLLRRGFPPPGARARARPPSASRLLLPVASPRPSSGFWSARLRRHRHGRRDLSRRRPRRRSARSGGRRSAATPAADLAGSVDRARPQGRSRATLAVPARGAPPDPGKADRRRRSGRTRPRDSHRRSPDRLGYDSGRQFVFLTSKTLQQKMAVSALTAMNERSFHTLQVRAKEKMCANDRILCHEDFCRFAKDYPEKMARSNILGRLRDSYSHHDPDTVFEEARREEVCPFEVQLELAQRADAIVADYNYVFEPGVALRHLQEENLPNAILLVDEAHNLPDRARQIYSPELLEEDWRKLANELALQPGEIFAALAASVEDVLALMSRTADELPEG